MMKRKLFLFACILCIGWLCMSYKSVSKTSYRYDGYGKSKKAKKFILTDVMMLPGKVADSANPQSQFTNLFENNANGIRLNPRAVTFVQDYMEKNSEELLKMKRWAQPYFNLIDNILQKYGLPTELKYLAVIESQLKRTAVSWAGAVGPWQLMPETARILGLKVTKTRDERTDFYKSTHAAAKYLRDLYNEFNDWLLVIAAYNGGPANVYSAIRKSGGSRNFWDIQYYLPAESRNHVKKFIGTHYIFEGQGSVTTLTRAEAEEQIGVTATYLLNRRITTEENNNARSVIVSGKYFSEAIARHIMMDMSDFERYNPDFDKKMASANNVYELKLPADKMELFNANKYIILNESVQLLLNSATASSK
jgi:membrane-bound lytic murein transglycosylase D